MRIIQNDHGRTVKCTHGVSQCSIYTQSITADSKIKNTLQGFFTLW